MHFQVDTVDPRASREGVVRCRSESQKAKDRQRTVSLDMVALRWCLVAGVA
jgi:hypothetical protein